MAGRSSYSAKGVAPENVPPPVTDDSESVQSHSPLAGEFESTPVVCYYYGILALNLKLTWDVDKLISC